MKQLLTCLAAAFLVLQSAPAEAPGPVIGIGTELKVVDGKPVVSSLLPDSPASRIGIHPGDRLTKIDDKSVNGLSLHQVAELLHGAAHSHVHVTVDRNGHEKNFGLRREILYMPGSHKPEAP